GPGARATDAAGRLHRPRVGGGGRPTGSAAPAGGGDHEGRWDAEAGDGELTPTAEGEQRAGAAIPKPGRGGLRSAGAGEAGVGAGGVGGGGGEGGRGGTVGQLGFGEVVPVAQGAGEEGTGPASGWGADRAGGASVVAGVGRAPEPLRAVHGAGSVTLPPRQG